MSSNRTMKTSRYGIQALYTFTPFKLLRAHQSGTYELILAETAHHQVKGLTMWHSKSVKDKFIFSFSKGFSKTIIQPYGIYPTTFSSQMSKKYIYVSKKHEWRYFPEYIEFSLDTLREAHYCYFGWVLLSSNQNDCPLARECPVRSGAPCRYYLPAMSYSRLYNVYPIIRKKYEAPADKKGNVPLAAIRYQRMPLATITYVPNGNYLAFIDGVTFRPKRAKMSRYPLIFLREGLGFKVSYAPAIQFEFNKETLKEMLQERLKSNLKLARWIKLKQQLYMSKNSDSLIKEREGFNAFNRLDEVVSSNITGENSERAQDLLEALNQVNVDDDLVDFASVLFIHSFAHLFLNWISAKYGYTKGDIEYYLEHDRFPGIGLQKEGVRIFVFEAAVGGLGYLKNFAQSLEETGERLLSETLKEVLSVLNFCERKSNEKLVKLPSVLNDFKANYPSSQNLVDSVLKAYGSLAPNKSPPDVYPHINSIRKAVVTSVTSQNRDLLDDLLDMGPHCWDGCQLCVMLERECNYLPFDQPFLVSRVLAKDLIEILIKMVDSPTQNFPLQAGFGEVFERFVSSANHEVCLVSPWLSVDVVKALIEKAELKELNVRIITTNDINNRVHQDSLKVLREHGSSRISTKTSAQLHAKGMLVDNVMLLAGSFNFTNAGLKLNVENLTVDFSNEGTRTFKKEFEAQWAKSEPLQ